MALVQQEVAALEGAVAGDLAVAEPAAARVAEALEALDKNSLIELKAIVTPPKEARRFSPHRRIQPHDPHSQPHAPPHPPPRSPPHLHPQRAQGHRDAAVPTRPPEPPLAPSLAHPSPRPSTPTRWRR